METPGLASFPDSVSTRGLKHLRDLIEVKKMGHRACMLYVVARSDAERFTSAIKIDPDYAQGLKDAHKAGVEIYCYRVEAENNVYILKTALPIEGLT